MKIETKRDRRTRIHLRQRKRVKGTAERPRMAICISNKHIYVQFIDDGAMCTLASTSSLKEAKHCNMETAQVVGEQAATVAKEKGISNVVVDRGGFRFHGRVQRIVEAAISAGLRITERAAEVTEEAK